MDTFSTRPPIHPFLLSTAPSGVSSEAPVVSRAPAARCSWARACALLLLTVGCGAPDDAPPSPSLSEGMAVQAKQAEPLETAEVALSTGAWSANGETAGNGFGHSVTSAGDVNHDGYGDVLVSAYAYNNNTGRVYLYLGGPAGPGSTAAWTATGSTTNELVGSSISSAGDVNGDGYGDVIIGASGASSNIGKALLYLGSATGLESTAAWTGVGEAAANAFGGSVSGAGDVNGDGYGDVLVGAIGHNNSTGKAYLYLGSTSGLSITPAWTGAGEAVGNEFSGSMASAGDINADGYGDVIIAAVPYSSNSGRAYVYLGNANGLETTPAWTATGQTAGHDFGNAVSSAGDVNGDGYGDVLIGIPGYGSDPGRAVLYLGSAVGLSSTVAWFADGDAPNDELGTSLSSAGDINGDGYGDVILGTGDSASNNGKVAVYLGTSTGLSASAAWTKNGESANSFFGQSVSSAGDVNGDGWGDVIVGAYGHNNTTGKVTLYIGNASVLTAAHTWTATGEATGNYMGWSVISAGDVNADGYGDVMVASFGHQSFTGKLSLYLGGATGIGTTPAWTAIGDSINNSLGLAMSSAGDVNGDGYGDVVVGANANTNFTGKAHLYLGNSTGLSALPVWSTAGEAINNYYGQSVSAGDVNGDGFSDVMVGAYGNSANTGKAYLYLGSPSGLSTTPSWTVTGEAAGNGLGNSISTAGDVNRDGFGDVIVGAQNHTTNTGKVYLYLGSIDGLASTPSWSAMGENTSSTFGYSLASAGDVNSDGYGDILVGSNAFTSNTGRAYLYLGTPTGLTTSAAWTATGEATGNFFGNGVGSAGDVDGDGYGDVVIGAPGFTTGTGKAYLYLGSASGLKTTTAWTAVGEVTLNSFGFSARTAGDVNGDGFSDVLVGAPRFTSYTGKAFLYLGNGAEGSLPALPQRPLTLQPDGQTPIVREGRSSDKNSLTVATLSGRSSYGRMPVRLQVELKARGAAFDGTDLIAPTAWTDSGLIGAKLTTLLASLPPETDYHWRARVQYHPAQGVKQGWSRWLYGPRPGDARGIHARTGCALDFDGDRLCDGRDPDGDNDGDPDLTDCGDFDPAIKAGAVEVCNSIDDNCADGIDEGVLNTYYLDQDGDGDGIPSASTQACSVPPGYASTADDCLDSDASVYLDAPELCDEKDNDCDTQIDEAVQTTFYRDEDGDGHGTASTSTQACSVPPGYAAASDDCLDSDASVYLDAPELCDAKDNDCDSTIDEGVMNTYYPDQDGDGHGSPSGPTQACSPPPGYVVLSDDCNDGNAAIYTTAPELCDAQDNDCDSSVDEGVQTSYYLDQDGDGHGISSASQQACSTPTGYSALSDDCNDTTSAISPSAAEICNGQDDNCNLGIDEGTSDDDQDGICNALDQCAEGDDTEDGDEDEIADDCDNCPEIANPGQEDADQDETGDVCEEPEVTPPPEPTATPEPTGTPGATATPAATATPEPTGTPDTSPTPSPEPTSTPEPTPTLEPPATPTATAAPEPSPSPSPELVGGGPLSCSCNQRQSDGSVSTGTLVLGMLALGRVIFRSKRSRRKR